MENKNTVALRAPTIALWVAYRTVTLFEKYRGEDRVMVNRLQFLSICISIKEECEKLLQRDFSNKQLDKQKNFAWFLPLEHLTSVWWNSL